MLVSDPVLRKAHPELPKQFRGKYQVGLSAPARALGDGDKLAKGAALYGAGIQELGNGAHGRIFLSYEMNAKCKEFANYGG